MGSERRMYLLASLALYSLCSLAAASQLKIMTAPNILRVETYENIFVECQGCTEGEIAVSIRVWDFPAKATQLNERTSVTLNKDNHFQQFAKIKISSHHFTVDDERNKYVYLQAQFGNEVLDKVVLVSFQSGYIFIQTDKTLYTPDSRIQFRLFGVTPQVVPLDEPSTSIDIEIMTPEGVALSLPNAPFSLISGYYDGAYQLSKLASPGVYKVVAKFLSNPQYVYSAEFEVKEYVLPNFEVKLKSRDASFRVDREELLINIEANYLFDEKVEGTATVVFGIMHDGQKKPFPNSVKTVEITEGVGEVKLTKADIQPLNLENLIGGSIFVHASVQTEDGAEMVYAELRNIKIVSSPYTIYFRRTPKYFKPGMDFDVVIETLKPDGSPAKHVQVVLEPGRVTGSTEENGMARLSINTNPNLETLIIKAETAGHDGPPASSTMTVLPYSSPSKSYIHIGIGKAEVQVGENLKVNFNYNQRDVGHDITYLVLSKGQLVKYDRYTITEEVVVSTIIHITKDMIPSFRIIAYYHTQSKEVVADSVWVDVQDTCMGSLNLEIGNTDYQFFEPKDNIALKITGDPGATVALVAVDKGVFLLNNKLRLTQQKIWETVEKQDTGCTPGGGQNNMGVFYDAGLVFSSTASSGTPSRQEMTCPSPSRRKRSSSLRNVQTSLVSQYTEKILRDCCLDGMKKTLLSYTCERRSQYIIDGPACVQAFLRCCKEVETLESEEREDKLVLARSEEADDDYNPDEIISRSNFPESWHWTSVKLPACDQTTCTKKTNPFPLKDTITTWEFVGISFSRENSICVAEPLSVVARKDFFVKLHLPYSVVRGEQVQIKAVVYNYRRQASTVRVDLKENDKLCSAASRRGFYRQEIRIPARGTRSVPFVIIPLGLGPLDVEVQAAVKGRETDIRDGIKKKLFVVSEGKLMNKVVHCSLDPTKKGGRDEATINSKVRTQDLVPGAPTSTMVFVTGKNQLGSLMTDVISGKSLSRMIKLPSGCGEQNLFGMTMTVITTIYLDKTGQWQEVGVDRRYTALQYIQTGYINEIEFRKPDGSFAVFKSRPGSTWLTAFVVKVFAMAYKFAAVREQIVCDALTFLMNQQQENGRFRDIGTVLSQNMISGLRGKDSDASMTAFCLMAMQEARIARLCPRLDNLQSSMDKAVGYLEGRLPALANPYAVTITSCALAAVDKLDRQILKRFMSTDSTHWRVDDSDMFTVEATAYGLLALVKAKALDEAKPVVRWFRQYERYLGSYGSTQVTIMVYQAIAEYWSSVSDEAYDLNINLKLPGRSGVTQLFITKDNYMSTRSDELDLINEDVKVVATGVGEATLKVVSFYYAQLKQKDSNCKKFNLSVALTQDENEETVFTLSIKVMYLDPEHDATMAILDIGLLTGFLPDKTDLDALSKGPSRVIQKYETNTEGSSEDKDKDQNRDRGSLIIYLDKVSHTEVEEITFRLHQKVLGSRLQPAAVTIYEYYDLHNQNDTNCVRFYHPKRPSGELLMLCRHGECTCAEEECTKQKKEKVDNDDRIAQSCLSTQDTKTDYVFKVKVMNITEELSTDIYTMQIVQVIKDGTDRGAFGHQREFLSYKHCKWALDLVPDKTYLIMGADKDIRIDPQTHTYQYVLGERTWIEYWPTDEECQSQEEKYVNVCKGIAELKYKYDNLLCRQ